MIYKEGIIIGYSDTKFFWDVLQGEAYRYWWDALTRRPSASMASAAWSYGNFNCGG